MSGSVSTIRGVEDRAGASLVINVAMVGLDSVVSLSGELDISTRALLLQACGGPPGQGIVVDAMGLTFMDCAGYSGVVAVRRAVEDRGCTFRLRNTSGQPERLVAMLAPFGVDPFDGDAASLMSSGQWNTSGSSRRFNEIQSDDQTA